jgi:predicted acylesterase/phospholipase RssA
MPAEKPTVFEAAHKECDLVMKGGLTSGIVYPPLVDQLHKAGFSFRNVGGTSAGAIAAAVAAAAEHGKASGGFEKLIKIREWLGSDANLLNLFKPSRTTAPLLRTFLVYPKLNWLRLTILKLVVALAWGDALAFVVGAALGSGLSYLFIWLVGGSLRGWGIVFLALSGLVGAMLCVALHLYLILTKSVPRNFFGICTGRGRNLEELDETALTDWLTVNLNDLAGMEKNGRPLTFGDLWDQKEPADSKRIDLRMMTTNLSQNRPYVLPFDDIYLVKQDAFEKLFPKHVVDFMISHQRKIPDFQPPQGYFLFPEGRNLPVVVATRMSLSFPVLISMIPIYTIAHDAFGENVRFELDASQERSAGDLRIVLKVQGHDNTWVQPGRIMYIADTGKTVQPNWFSDGGICSNFPIHFFDSWLPTRPTFGVNLTSQLGDQTDRAPSEGNARVANPQRFPYAVQQPLPSDYLAAPPVRYDTDVYLPQPGSEALPEWIPIQTLTKFLGSIFRTAQNYRDNMQAVLPSYYERIVQIRMSDDEGGLNLEMPPEVIERVVRKGSEAGSALVNEFDFAKHQWVRFRVLMGQMEKALQRMDAVMKRGATGARPFDFPRLMVDQASPSEGFPYRRDKPWCDNATTRLKAMGAAISTWVPPELANDPPLPEPVLHVAPEI